MIDQFQIATKIIEHIQGLLRAGWSVDRIAKWLDIPWTWVDLVRRG